MDKTLCGYAGIYQAPLNDWNKPIITAPKRSSVYCITTPDRKTLVMIPLVTNFFETAYSIARSSKYQNIYLILPVLDMLMISDIYQLYFEICINLQKDMEIFCHDRPQILVSDDFYAHVHVGIDDQQYQIGEYNSTDDSLNIVFSFPNDHRPLTRSASDIYIMTNNKKILLSMYMSDEKIKFFGQDENIDRYDEIHMPFIKNLYGGINYMRSRRLATPRLSRKYIAYGFQDSEEVTICRGAGGIVGEVLFSDFV